MSGNKKLAEARILAAKQMPYLRAGLMGLVPVERPGLGTMAMDAYGRLYFDPAFLETRELKHRAFVVLHEFVHYHQRHAQRQKAVVRGEERRLAIWRMAVDASVNDILEQSGLKCPEEGVTPAKLGLPRNNTPEGYFAMLLKRQEEAEQRAEEERKRQEEAETQRQSQEEQSDAEDDQSKTADHDQEPEAGQDESPADEACGAGSDDPGSGDDLSGLPEAENTEDEADDGEGDCGDPQDQGQDQGEVGDESQDGQGEADGQEASEGGQGEASGEEPASDGDGTDGSGDGRSGQGGKGQGAAGGQGEGQGAAGQALDALSDEELAQLAQGIGGSACDGVPRPWELGPPSDENPGLSESDQKMIEVAVAKAIEQHIAARGVGSVPNPLAKQASELLHKPVDPCRELAAITKYAVDTIAGFGDFTYSRASNRQIPGGCIMPTAVKPVPRITLIIDSSRSMGSDDTAMALDVLGSVLKNLPDPRGLRVLVGGTRVEAARRVFKPEQIDVLDGGGTDIGALIRLADQERPAPKVILCVTDGETPWCAERDVKAKVMVCLTRHPRWCSPPPAWMKTVCLHPDAD